MNKLIKLSDTHYIVVDNSEIKDGDYFYNNFNDNQPKIQQRKGNWVTCFNQYRITHSTQLSDSLLKPTSHKQMHILEREIKLISLSEVEEAINGYSVEKMAGEATKKQLIRIFGEESKDDILDDIQKRKYYYTLGFKAHQELIKDKNKEVIELLTNITEWSSFKEHPIGKQAQRALDILFPKTEWDVEFDEQGKLKLT